MITLRERKMRTNFFCTTFLNTPRVLGYPGKIPGTSQIPLLETQGRQTFEGGHEVFDPHPSAWKTPTSPGGLRTQKVNLCALFSGLNTNEFQEGVLMTALAVLTVLTVLETRWRAPCPPFAGPLQNIGQRGNRSGFDGFGGFGRDGYPPPKLNPPFPSS